MFCRFVVILVVAMSSAMHSPQLWSQDSESDVEENGDSTVLDLDEIIKNQATGTDTTDDEDDLTIDLDALDAEATEEFEGLPRTDEPQIERSEFAADDNDQADDATELLPEPQDNLHLETIQERYPSGNIKIERQVTQDKDENYINHGPWVWKDDDGYEIAKCEFQLGRRHGPAFRWFSKDEAKIFSTAPFNQFTGPYKSTANFESGLLHGDWIVTDGKGRKICQWSFEHGRRSGKSTWWYNTGDVYREINYLDGELHGPMTEYHANGDLATDVEYINGRRLEKYVETNDDSEKTVEGMMLRARLTLKTRDNWWKAELAQYTKQGKDEKHGRWTAWYPNGQKKLEGEYQYDLPSGEYTWWHDNGQKSIQAYYAGGKKEGVWTWWHKSGQKSIQGSYAEGIPTGRWTWWHESGKVAKRMDFAGANQSSRSKSKKADKRAMRPPTSQRR